MNVKPVSYLQTDAKWKNEPYRTSAESSTIGSAGCGPSCMAMVIATWVDPKVTPVTTTQWSMAHGYKATGNGTYHTYFKPQAAAYGLECKQLNSESFIYMTKANAEKYHQQAYDAVDDGCLVIALMGKGNWTSGGHFILWYSNSLDGKHVYINDPASTKEARLYNTFELLKSEVRFYWVITPPKEVISMLNSEVQAMVAEEVAKAMATIKPATVEPSSWAAEAWYGAFEQGVFDGTTPQHPLTREQAATVLSRLHLIEPKPAPEGFDWKTRK